MREGWCGQLATDEGFSGSGKILVQQCHGTPLKDRRASIVADRTHAVDDDIGRRQLEPSNISRGLPWICGEENSVHLRVDGVVRDPR
jgi:hypothetical protein